MKANSINSIKEKARNLIDKLPENSTWDDLMYEIYVRQAIESGLNDSEAGKATTRGQSQELPLLCTPTDNF